MNKRSQNDVVACAAHPASLRGEVTVRWLAWMLIVSATVSATALPAQLSSGMSGIIADAAGRPIAGVNVTLRDESGIIKSTTTRYNGQYQFPNAPDGMFSIAVRQSGFVPEARLLRKAPVGSLDFTLPAVEDSTVQPDVDANWRRDLELYDRAMLVADPLNVLTREDLEEGKFSFTGDLLNLLPGVPKAPSRTAARCTHFLVNDFPQRSPLGFEGMSISNIPTEQLKIVMVRTPGNPLPDVWRPFAYNSGCTVVAAYTL